MKKVLVLGGGGFIGSNIVQELVLRGDCMVTSADIAFPRSYKIHYSNSSNLNILEEDFTKAKAFNNLGEAYDEVYMLAAIIGVNRILKDPEEVVRTNTQLTMETLSWLQRCPSKRVLFASSSENYAGTSDLFDVEIPTSETVPLCISDIKHPRFTYAVTKIHGECAFLHSAGKLGYESVIVRYQNIIGPDMGFNHAIPHIAQRFVNYDGCKPFEIYGAEQTRAFCYVSDAVVGTIGAMECDKSAGEIYHIGNDKEITIEELTLEIGSILGYNGVYKKTITYPGSVARRCPNISKARQDFGYIPRIDWREAVARTVVWYKEYFSHSSPPLGSGFEPPEIFISKITNHAAKNL